MKKREFSFFDRIVLVVTVAFLSGTLAAFASWAEATSRAVQCACMWTITAVGGGFLLGRWMEIRDLARERKAFAQRYANVLVACRLRLDHETMHGSRSAPDYALFESWADALDRIAQEMKQWKS